MRTIAFIVMATAGFAASASAQDLPRWLLRAESGLAVVNDPGGVYGGVRAARIWKQDVVRLDAGLIAGTTDGGLFGADAGVEFRLCRGDCALAPYIGASLGAFHDRAGTSPLVRLNYGLEFLVGRRNLVRVGVFKGDHSTHHSVLRGPNGVTLGFARRF